MQAPKFSEYVPARCPCPSCAVPEAGSGSAASRVTLRGALVAAVGAALLAGGAGSAYAEPAPSHAGWDGSKYWYKDATGWWRWTSHRDKYLAHSGGQDTATATSETSGAALRTGGEPQFRGSQGWDPVDGVYWYRSGGHWWWTSHKEKYERHMGTSAGQDGAGPSRGTARPAPRPDQDTHRGGAEAAIAFARSHLGDPYVWGGNGPDGWDCSGLVRAAFQSAGVSLPRVADDQYRASRPLARGELRRGDLVFWSGNGSASGIHHVALYLGDGQYLEAPRPGKSVRISSFDWYAPNMYGRVV
ncbi:C40 family peptidase [Streptomyces sp. NPDC050504]|uniref:C40 family peptidase n=1 Tax=Streptomyces sp. NPDC050504 TaxID=3365618 RepID=UPI003798D226